MNIFSKLVVELRNPQTFFHKLYGVLLEVFAPCFGDRFFLKLKWRFVMGYPLNIDNPQTFNEKLQWLKLNDRNPEYTKMVDKYEAKKYVASIIGEEYVIPTIGIYENVEDINFDSLPDQFVLKCTHDSGGVVVCKDKSKLDLDACKRKLKKGLKANFYYQNREWPYKNVKPQIIAEQYIEDETGELRDYKLMCFDGKVKCSFTVQNRFKSGGIKMNFYDRNWIKLPFSRHYPNSEDDLPMPTNYELMIRLAEKLSKNLRFARIDLYNVNGKIYFGEITFYPGSGWEEFTPFEWDKKLGDFINIESTAN